jgi:outer membrane protein OmpA-like peptidoglycan-associated protein
MKMSELKLKSYLTKLVQIYQKMTGITKYFLISFLFLSSTALAQDIFSPFYVVIGGFEQEENARKFCDYAMGENLPAVYAFNEERKIFYVYVRATQTKEVALEILKTIRENSIFKDAWVFNGNLSGSNLTARKARPEERPPLTKPVQETPQPVIPEEKETASVSVPGETTSPVEAPKPVGKAFVFKLTNSATGSSLDGLVRLQESDRSLQFRGYNGNEKVYVAPPANRSGKWYVVCQVVGFKQFKKAINYSDAQDAKGASIGPDQEIVIPIQMERVRKGDYIEMDGVKFFNNAALLTPGSERELDELYAMMEENQGYHIRLHGHTNGNEPRDIVSLGDSKNFFGPDVANAKTHGTAKDLSLMRADLVKAYLVNKGIDGSRISVKGEGGTQMIFESGGTLAGMNDRVEVEITKY